MRALKYLLIVGCLSVPAASLAQCPDGKPSCEEIAYDGVSGQAQPAAPSLPPQNLLSSSWYFRGEYLIWWLREGHVPPLLTTSPPSARGILGAEDTQVIYGDDRLQTRHGDRFVGTRVTAGYWFDCEQSVGLEAAAVFLERDSTYFKATSSGDILLARPYFNVLDGSSQSEIIAGPTPAGVRSGGFNGYSRIELFDEEANFVIPLWRQVFSFSPTWASWTPAPTFRCGSASLELLAGAHFLQMRDRLDLTATGRLLPDNVVLFGETDHYRADNRFYGGQAGLRGQYSAGPFFINARGSVALGGNDEVLRTFGDRLVQTPTSREVQSFGLYVLPTNNGRFTDLDFDVVSEFTINAGCRLTRHLSISAGYTLLLWNNPIRAGDQVDLAINPTQVTGPLSGPARPAVPFRTDSFWGQGVNVGMEVCW
jgi:hypothetical protein